MKISNQFSSDSDTSNSSYKKKELESIVEEVDNIAVVGDVVELESKVDEVDNIVVVVGA